MILQKEILITNIKKRTRGDVLKDVKKDDILIISTELLPVGTGSKGRTYAPKISITNTKNDDTVEKTYNRMTEFYDVFDFVEFK